MGHSWSRGGSSSSQGPSSRSGTTAVVNASGETMMTSLSSTPMYRYPPRSGRSFFSSHFIMGGEKFSRLVNGHQQYQDNFLFGDNSDLNLLGGQPTHFPYPAPHPHEPTRTLRALINVRKDSIALVVDANKDENDDDPDHENAAGQGSESGRGRHRLTFLLDADVRCWVRVHLFCVVRDSNQGPRLENSRQGMQCTKSFDFQPGASQCFNEPLELDLNECREEIEAFANAPTNEGPGGHKVALAIHVGCREGQQQSMLTLARIEATHAHPNGYVVKPTKQKLYVDGLGYLLQEIYGLENKHVVCKTNTNSEDNESDDSDSSDEDIDDSHNLECVVCMSQHRDTLILPCRHLCLCHHCADTLRYQASNCPICRAPFHALLQIRTVVRKNSKSDASASSDEEEGERLLLETNDDTFFPPSGYKSISLAESLNGRRTNRPEPKERRVKKKKEEKRVEERTSVEIVDEESQSNAARSGQVSSIACSSSQRSGVDDGCIAKKSEDVTATSKPPDLSLSSPNVSVFVPDESRFSSAQQDEDLTVGRHVRIYSLPGTPVSPSLSYSGGRGHALRSSRRGQSIIVHVSPPVDHQASIDHHQTDDGQI